jgi:hypothetical protein
MDSPGLLFDVPTFFAREETVFPSDPNFFRWMEDRVLPTEIHFICPILGCEKPYKYAFPFLFCALARAYVFLGERAI